MILAIPISLLLLTILPIIILLHFYRRKKKSVTVPSLLIWQRVLKEHKKLFRIKKLLANINLILQLAAAAALIIALGQPMLVRDLSSFHGNIICILDDSASMKALESGEQRFELARREALDLAAQLDDGYEMMVLGTGPRPNVISPFSSDRNLLRDRIRGTAATDQSDNMAETVRFAQSLRKPGDRIFLITDGAIELVDDIELMKNLHIVSVAEGGENTGITRFQFRKNLNAREGYEIFLQVENFGTQSSEGGIVIKVDKYILKQKRFALSPGENISYIFQYEGLAAGSATAELIIEDDLETDNKAYDVFQEDQEISVLYVSPGNTFLENVLRAYPRMKVYVPESPGDVDSSAASEYDIIVYDRIIPPVLSKGNLLLISTIGINLPVSGDSIISSPEITWWDDSHPLTKGLDLKDLTINSAIRITAESSKIIPVIKSGITPLAFVYTEKDLRIVYIGFDLLGSDFPLRTSFPLFISKAVNFLNTGYLERPDFQISPGDPFTIKFPRSAESYTITTADRRKIIIPYDENGKIFLQTEQAGFYRITGPEYTSAFAVNMTDPGESDITPKVLSSANGINEDGSPDYQTIHTPVWYIFILIALLCIIAEWLIWIKKWD